MKCPNCKVKLQKNSKYCPRCGYIFDKDSVTSVSEELSVDNYMGYYVKGFDNGKGLKKFSLSYFLFPFGIPLYYKMPFLSLNLLLLILHFFFANNFIGAKTGPFAFFYIFFSFLAIIYYWIYYSFNFNRLRVEDAKIRTWKVEKENKDKSEKEIEDAIKKDSRGNLILFIASFVIVPIICYGFLKVLEYLVSL